MLSSRYAPAVLVALLLALVPTLIHSYAGVVVADDRETASIPSTLASYTSTPARRSADWGKRRFESYDWFDRDYRSDADHVVLTVVRSYDLKALYHHPELAVAYHTTKFDQSGVQTLPNRPDMPIHVLKNRQDGAVGMYVLHYDDRFVADPITFQLRTAAELLFTGRKPMTLFFVLDDMVPEGAGALMLPAAQLLSEAVDRFIGRPSPGQ
jgi:hypothetical protein